MSYDLPVRRSQAAGSAFTVATLPTLSQMVGEPIGMLAYTTDSGLYAWTGSTWNPVSGGATIDIGLTPSVVGFQPNVHLSKLNSSAGFTGSISGTTLTVAAGSINGQIVIGQTLSGTGVTAGTTITAGSGTTWTVSASQTVAATTMTTIMTNVRVAFVGDSTLSGGETVSGVDNYVEQMKAAFQSAYPAKSFTFADYTIGGTVLNQFSATGVAIGGTLPSWFTVTSSTWSSYVSTFAPTVVLIGFGINDPGNEWPNVWATQLTLLCAYTTVPDIALITDTAANPAAGPPYNTTAYIRGFAANAQLARTLCSSGNNLGISNLPRLGLIDVSRQYSLLVYGKDPTRQVMSQVIGATTPLGPYSGTLGNTPLPYACDGDFDVTLTFNNGSAWSGLGTTLTIGFYDSQGGSGTGAGYGFINCTTTNGTTYYTQIYWDKNNGAFLNNINSGNWSSTTNTVQISVKNGHLRVVANGVVNFDGNLPMASTTFTPWISAANLPTNTTISISSMSVGTAVSVPPQLTATQVYGSIGGTTGGNGVNHLSSIGYDQIVAPVIESTVANPAAASISAGSSPVKTKTTLFTGNGTYTPSTGVIAIGVLVVGGGAGGGFGGTYAAATGGSGGAGGGGAPAWSQTFRASDISGTPTITIGAGGAGGQSGVTPTGGSIAGQGARGGITSFGTYLYAGGGGGGAPGISITASGGGSGGLVANVNGGFGTNSASGQNALFIGNGGFGASGSFSGTSNGAGGGGTTALGAGFTGGVNVSAPAGGAGGGGFNASGVAQSGANAQTIIIATGGASYVGGGAAGTAGVAAGAGAAGSAIPWPYLGLYIATGGAGGGAGFGTAITGGNGAVGGAGGNYGGGGAGGGAGNSTNGFVGGNGGSGAGGLVFIVEYF